MPLTSLAVNRGVVQYPTLVHKLSAADSPALLALGHSRDRVPGAFGTADSLRQVAADLANDRAEDLLRAAGNSAPAGPITTFQRRRPETRWASVRYQGSFLFVIGCAPQVNRPAVSDTTAIGVPSAKLGWRSAFAA
jgi:hypothetical protein